MEIINDIPVHPGIEEFTSRCREHGLETMILSSGLNILADVIMEKYGFHHVLANELLFEDGLVTGRVIPHVPFDEKDRALLEYLQERGIAPLECVAIGDGANDIPMFKVCGHGIAFNPTADIHEHVDIVIDNADLRSVIPVIDKIINNPL